MGVIPPYSMPVSTDCSIHREERCLAYVEEALDDSVDVGAGVGEYHAGRQAFGSFAFAADHDTVGERVEFESELLLGRGGVGERWIDLDHAHLLEQAGIEPA